MSGSSGSGSSGEDVAAAFVEIVFRSGLKAPRIIQSTDKGDVLVRRDPKFLAVTYKNEAGFLVEEGFSYRSISSFLVQIESAR